MGIYKQYKHGASAYSLTKEYGVRKTYNALRKKLGKTEVRIKHNKLQVKSIRGTWTYR
jgi:hypothetical protein